MTGAVAAAERHAAVAAVAAAGAAEDPDATSVTAAEPAARHRPEAPTLIPATRVDRFLILEKLGEGGMGTVYAAYDTLLDRKVAMKVVRPDRRTAVGGVPPRERLLREAQAMARLRHPNVVAVLEVGELGEDVYLTLELVEGQTLKTWLRAARRPWREVVAAFLAAGRGLAAAHAAGLVHRDFKPDNVLIGTDGRIQVADFGVASMSHGPRELTPSGDSLDVEGGEAFTLSGLRVGTPAYMSPEQHAGGTVDARADQFSFCVALWEGVMGERPFSGGVAPAERVLRPPPAAAAAPGWLVALLRRGMAASPDARWPSMDALLAELGRDRGLARRRIALALGLGVALAGVGALAVVGWTRGHAAPPRPCQDEARLLVGVWDDARAAALTEALVATRAPGAAAAAARVRGFVDRWSADWVVQRTEACAATRVHGDQSEAMLDARMRCLDRRLERVNQLVGELGTLPPDQVSRAVEIASDLPGLTECADGEQLTAAVPLPNDPAVRAGIERVDDGLAHALAVEQTGHYPAALALAKPLVGQAQALAYPPLHAEALAVLGRLHAQVGEHAAAVAALEEASAMAASAHADDVAADALIELIWATTEAGQGGRALAMAPGATAAVARTHDPRLEATLVSQLGTAELTAGDAAAAIALLERALALTERAWDPRHVRVAQVLNRLGNAEDGRGRPAEARAYYARALAIAEAQLGPEHPSVAVTRANLCYLDSLAGKLDLAAACQVQVIATLEAALGPDHAQVAWARNDAGLIAMARGRLAEARQLYEQALAIWRARSGPQHPDVAWPLVNLGELALLDDDAAGAAARCREALAIVDAASGADHPDSLPALACLGAALAEAAPRAAAPLLERAARLGAADDTGEVAAALTAARARLALGNRDRRAAARLAGEALAAYDRLGPSAATARRALVAWMGRRGIASP